jgi:long-chain acyl-CoA synthetase
MKKEELIEYKKMLSTLSEEQKKSRDLYLKRLSSGEIQGPSTGYPTIDKPWLKYMEDKEIVKRVPVKNVYQELYDNNKDYLDQVALMYFGAKITYREFFENIDKTAKALVANGVGKSDFVTISSALNPETLYAFYALAKIGAVANFMSPYFDKDGGMIDRIADCDSRIAIVMDSFMPELEETLENSIIEKIVVLPTLNSSPIRFLKKSIKPKKNSNEISWNSFIKEGRNAQLPSEVPFEDLMPLAMVYSSGSTGASKAILLTHNSFENSIHAYPRCDVNLNRGEICYQIVPPWFSTGISTSAHLPLSNGCTLFMDPRFERKVFVKNNLRLNPSATIAAISMFQGFLEEDLLGKGNLSNLNVVFQGGEKMEMKDKLNIEKAFKRYNSNARLMNGYGQCECGAGITTQTINTPSNTTVGIPIPGVTVGIFDEDRNELPYNTRGEILVATPCGMKEYFKNPKATEEYFYIDEAGIKWSCTGDIGTINYNGELEIHGRACDYSMIDGNKIYNFDIENVIRSLEFIQNCDVFTDNNGELVCHIILKNNNDNDYEEIVKYIQRTIYEYFNDSLYVPEVFKFREAFPAAKSGKRDVNKMKAETDGFIRISKTSTLDSKKLVRK